MKVDNFKIPIGFSNTKNCKVIEGEDIFSQVLSEAINFESKNLVKVEIENILSLDTIDERESELYLQNPLALALEVIPFRIEELDLTKLEEKFSENINSPDPILSRLDSYFSHEVTKSEKENLLNSDLTLDEDNLITYKENIFIHKENLHKEPTIIYKDRIIKEENINQQLSMEVENFQGEKEKLITQTKDEIGQVKKDNLENKNDHKDFIDSSWVNGHVRKIENMDLVEKTHNDDFILSRENIQRINDSIVKLMETEIKGNESIMKVELYPKELGNINVTLTMEEGKLVAKILVDSEPVKEMFTKSIDKLSNNLIKQDIIIEKVQVDLNYNSNSNSNWNFNHNNRNSFKRHEIISFNKESVDDVKEIEDNLEIGEISILA